MMNSEANLLKKSRMEIIEMGTPQVYLLNPEKARAYGIGNLFVQPSNNAPVYIRATGRH